MRRPTKRTEEKRQRAADLLDALSEPAAAKLAPLEAAVAEARLPPTAYRPALCRQRTNHCDPNNGDCLRCGAAIAEGCRNPPRPLHPGSCMWMGGSNEDGSCSACGQRPGVVGCSDPFAIGRKA